MNSILSRPCPVPFGAIPWSKTSDSHYFKHKKSCDQALYQQTSKLAIALLHSAPPKQHPHARGGQARRQKEGEKEGETIEGMMEEMEQNHDTPWQEVEESDLAASLLQYLSLPTHPLQYHSLPTSILPPPPVPFPPHLHSPPHLHPPIPSLYKKLLPVSYPKIDLKTYTWIMQVPSNKPSCSIFCKRLRMYSYLQHLHD